LDARDKAYWNSRALALMHLKRFDESLKAFDAALALDPAYEPAIEGRKTAEMRQHVAAIEAHAERVVRFEQQMRRPASREEIFKYCSVPLDNLDEVIKYVNEPAPLAPGNISPEELRKYEAVGASLLAHAPDLDSIRLTDVSAALPRVDLEEAREIWGYLDWIRDAPLEPTPEWHNDDLIRQALDLPKEEWNLVDLAKELRLGPFEAKKLEVSLKIFEGGGYRITTKAPPEPPHRKKAKPEVRPSTPVKEAKDEAGEGDDEEATAAEPPAAKHPAKPNPEDEGPTRCTSHKLLGTQKHECGTWLCKACLEGGAECPGCHEPLGSAKPKPAEKRETDPARDFSRL
jgi:tetratricopeptide (TPR) repeat protein